LVVIDEVGGVKVVWQCDKEFSRMGYYDTIADIYDQTRWLTESVAEEVADFMLELVDATPETSFLEPGVGTGLNIIPLVKRGYSVTGIDVSQPMLDQFRKKLNEVPQNLNLIHADASQLPFPDQSFDVVLTVHMVHAVSDWQMFLSEIDRVLKPQGFYLDAQWITPPARLEFEHYFRAILSKYEESQEPKHINKAIEESKMKKSDTKGCQSNYLITADIKVADFFHSRGYQSSYLIAKQWTVSNTVEELLSYFKSRAYGICWRVSDEKFYRLIQEFEEFCVDHYGSLETEVSSEAKFEIWVYAAS
jgi:ubiquinone/menaquinone biosynthesis C-methylase UbiE